MTNLVKNKVIIVTGANRGIGKSIVERLADEEAIVYGIVRNIPENGTEIYESNNKHLIKLFSADVKNYDSLSLTFGEIVKLEGKIDVLVNNAGITKDNLLLRMTESDWDDVIDTNLKGTFLAIKAVLKTMMSQRYGRIINIGSVVGSIGNAGQANYAASKAGLIGLTKSVAKELASRNILVNLIAPGYVRTDMTEKLTEEQKDFFVKNIPLKRVAEPKEIADSVIFFSSDLSNYITGEVLHVNGGLYM
jgi:3-oxoacyl-[acyl-carrier protein] reductase